MFQYAAGRALSLRLSVPLFLDLSFLKAGKLQKDVEYREYGLDVFDIEADIMAEVIKNEFYKKALRNYKLKISGVNRKLFNYSIPIKKIYTEKKRSYNREFGNLSRNTYLDGYWSSPKYFEGYEDVIRNDFRFKIKPDVVNKKLISEISNQQESVAIHIRKGDFSKLDKLGVTEMDYYQCATEYYLQNLKNPVFYLFGNDPVLAGNEISKLFGGIKIIPVDINQSVEKNIEDMRLITFCNHQIIGNSTFGWWGAWLNKKQDKMVAAPKKIFNDPKLNEEIQDMIPENWLRF